MAEQEEAAIDYGFTLRSDEIAFLKLGGERCECGHLKALHSLCCGYCLVCEAINNGLLLGQPPPKLDECGMICTEGPRF
jgi:hypothetical protein